MKKYVLFNYKLIMYLIQKWIGNYEKHIDADGREIA
jgi:hypothetical protein